MKYLVKRALAISLAILIPMGAAASDMGSVNAYAAREDLSYGENQSDEMMETSLEELPTEEPDTNPETEESVTEELQSEEITTSAEEPASGEEPELPRETIEEETSLEEEIASWDEVTEEEFITSQGTVGTSAESSCELGIDGNGVLEVESGDASALSGVVKIPAGTRVIPNGIFTNNTKVTGVTFLAPDDLKEIGEAAFFNSGITQIEIPKMVTTIGVNAFFGSRLKTVTLSKGGNGIDLGNYAFANCASMEEFVTNARLQTIGKGAFLQCAKLDNRVVNNKINFDLTSVTSIGEEAFLGCSSLTFIQIPETVGVIGSYAFSGCISLGKGYDPYNGERAVSFANGVTTISDHAFENCSNLKQVFLPPSVSNVGENAFSGCNALTSVKTENMQGLDGNCSMTLSYTSFPFIKGLVIYGYAGDIEEWVGDHVSYGIVYRSLYVPNSITIEGPIEHGKVKADATAMECGKKVLLTFTPDAGYVLDTQNTYVEDASGHRVPLEADNRFTMPSTWVRVFAKFILLKDVEYGDCLRLNSGTPIRPENGETEYDQSSVAYAAEPTGNTLTFEKAGKRIGLNIESGKILLNYTQYTIKSSDPSVVAVNQYGTVYALKEGKATITVTLNQNPNNSVKQLTIQVVVKKQTYVTDLSFDYKADSRINIEKVTDSGSEAEHIGYDLITIRSSLVSAEAKKITVYPIGKDDTPLVAEEGEDQEKSKIIVVPYTWSCLDSKIVSFDNASSTVYSTTLVINKGVIGETIVTVKTNQAGKDEKEKEVERKIIIRVIDDTPRLAEDKLTVDPLSDSGTQLDLVSNYGNIPRMTDLKIVQFINNQFTDSEITDVFDVTYSDEKCYLKVNHPDNYTANKKYTFNKCYLEGRLKDTGKIFQVPIASLTVLKKDIKPSFSLSGKINLFYNGFAKEEEIGKVTVTSNNKDLTIESCRLVGAENSGEDDGKFANNFTITSAPVDGKLYIKRTQNVMATYEGGNNDGKPVLSGYIKVTYKGYDRDFYYKVSVPNYTTAPTYTVTPSKVTLNALAADQVRTIQFINRKTKKPENLTNETTITLDRSDAGTNVNINSIETSNVDTEQDTLTLRFDGTNAKSGKVVLNLRQPSWEDQTWNKKSNVKMTVTVNVTANAPAAKLSKTTLQLNSASPKVKDSVAVTLNQEDSILEDNPTIKQRGTKQSNNLLVRYENGKIYASIREGTAVEKGTYGYTLTPKYHFTDGISRSAGEVNFSVKVIDTEPSMTLNNRTFTINANCYDESGKHDAYTTTFKWKDLPAEYQAYDFDTTNLKLVYTGRNADSLEITKEQCFFDILSQTMKIELKYKSYGTSSYRVEGLQLKNGDSKITIKPFTITVCAKNMIPTVTVSAKGTINPLDPESKIDYKPTLKNVSGKVDGVKLVELDDPGNEPMEEGTEHFEITNFDTATGLTTVQVKAGVTLEKRSYRIKLFYTIENSEKTCQVAKDQIITPKQTLPTVKLDQTSVKLFAGNKERTVRLKLTKTSTKTADIDRIIISESNKQYDLLKDAFETPQYDPETGIITLQLKNSALIKQNVEQNIILETHCKGQLQKTTGKTFTVKVTVVK